MLRSKPGKMSYITTTEQMGEYRVLPDTSIAFDTINDIAYGSIVNGVLCPLTEKDIALLQDRCITYNRKIWNPKWVEEKRKDIQSQRRTLDAEEADLNHLLQLIKK